MKDGNGNYGGVVGGMSDAEVEHLGSATPSAETAQNDAEVSEGGSSYSSANVRDSVMRLSGGLQENSHLVAQIDEFASSLEIREGAWPATSDMSQPWPEADAANKAARETMKLDDKRTLPFEGKTEPYVHLSCEAYDARIQEWIEQVRLEENPPTPEQMQVIMRVKARVRREFEELQLGDELHEDLRALIHEPEEPLRGLIHDLPGTGKSRVIAWICRFFEEAPN